MNEVSVNSSELTSILTTLSEFHQWELESFPLLTTLTGRHLYFRIVQRTVGEKALLTRSLKDLMVGTTYTEKALRIRMRQMESNGLIEAVSDEFDGRSKSLMPTAKFYEDIYSHANGFKKIIGKNFLLINK